MVCKTRATVVLACLMLLGGAGAGKVSAEGGAAGASVSASQRARHRASRRVARRRSVKKVNVEEVKRAAQRLEAGAWGGRGITLSVGEGRATLEYDCAHGEITGALELDAEGRFNLTGTHTPEHGGPVRVDEKPDTRPARYDGRVRGETMTLTVTLTDANEQVGTFTLTRGSEGRLFKCR